MKHIWYARLQRNQAKSGLSDHEQPAIKKCADINLVAVYSRSLKSAQSLDLQGVQLYSDDSGLGKTYDDLLKSSDIEAVIIAYVQKLGKGESY